MLVHQTNSASSYTEIGSASDPAETFTDDILVTAARKGDADAFSKLCERSSSRLFRMAVRITRNREDAEDAVQEAFLNAFAHLASFDGRSRFSTWLTRIGLNAALMKLRRKRSCREVSINELVSKDEGSPRPETTIVESAPNPEERYAQWERDRLLRAAVAELQPRLREAVEVYRLGDRPMQETAAHLGISVAAAKSRLLRANIALRQIEQLKVLANRVM